MDKINKVLLHISILVAISGISPCYAMVCFWNLPFEKQKEFLESHNDELQRMQQSNLSCSNNKISRDSTQRLFDTIKIKHIEKGVINIPKSFLGSIKLSELYMFKKLSDGSWEDIWGHKYPKDIKIDEGKKRLVYSNGDWEEMNAYVSESRGFIYKGTFVMHYDSKTKVDNYGTVVREDGSLLYYADGAMRDKFTGNMDYSQGGGNSWMFNNERHWIGDDGLEHWLDKVRNEHWIDANGQECWLDLMGYEHSYDENGQEHWVDEMGEEYWIDSKQQYE